MIRHRPTHSALAVLAIVVALSAPGGVASAAEVEDDRYTVSVTSESTGAVSAFLSAESTEPSEVDWELTGTGGVVQSGSVTIENRSGRVSLTGIAAGSYDFVTRADGPDTVTTSNELEVLAPVTATTGCQSLVLTNPSGNPALSVSFGNGIDEGGDSSSVPLASGQTRTIRTANTTIDWRARTGGPDNVSFSAGEDYDVPIQQGCGQPLVTATAICDGSTEQVRLTIDHLAEEAVGYLLGDRRDGFYILRSYDENGRTQDTYVENVRHPGVHNYELFLNGRSFDVDTFEEGTVTVPECTGGAAATDASATAANTAGTLPSVGADAHLLSWAMAGLALLVGGSLLVRSGRAGRSVTRR